MTEDLGHKAWIIQHLPKQSPAHRPKLHHILRFMQPACEHNCSCNLASARLGALAEVQYSGHVGPAESDIDAAGA